MFFVPYQKHLATCGVWLKYCWGQMWVRSSVQHWPGMKFQCKIIFMIAIFPL
eukprot:TRINITY_DN880_c0_g1_i1.p3 TRINITY_DN880_c0_g1~~TRINITY_DN880_c0_g1_i1.p3  ORF type:complete len:52 (+),score=0.81 TRINITY_DN880_c0_g1_i1:340-495(+)